MKQKTSQIIYAYWNEVRGSRLAPRRFDIEPSRIAHVLPETFILEHSDARSYRFRLAGTRICDTFGFELRGSDFLDLWNDADRTAIDGHLRDLAARGGVGVASLTASTAQGRACRMEAVVMPLIHLKPAADRFLGGLSSIDQPGWLGSERITSVRLTEFEVIWPDGRPHALVERFQNQSPFHPALAGAKVVRFDRRQFRVFEGGKGKGDRDPG